MLYRGYFQSLEGNNYSVDISTKDSEFTTKDNDYTKITLTDDGFVTKMSNKADNMYSQLRLQTASVSILAEGNKDFKFDLYSPTAQGTKVRLLKWNDDYTTSSIQFIGYCEPIIYDMNYISDTDEITLNVTDGLSTLEYFKYDCEGFDTYMNVTMKSVNFQYMLDKIIKKAGYKGFYFPTCLRYSAVDKSPILDKLIISEKNFFDDKDDNDNSDFDTAATYKSVLSQLCMWLNVSAQAYKDEVYFLDLDAVQNMYKEYYYYTNGTDKPTTVNLLDRRFITQDSYKGNDNTISLDDVYSRIKIKDKFNKYDSILPDIFDERSLTNITAVNSTKQTEIIGKGNIMVDFIYGVGSGSYTTLFKTGDGNIEAIIDAAWVSEDEKKNYFTADRWLISDNLKCYMYNWEGDKGTLLGTSDDPNSNYPKSFTFKEATYDSTINWYGAIVKQEQVKAVEKNVNTTAVLLANGGDVDEAIKLCSRNVSTLDMENTIVLLTRGNPYGDPTFRVGSNCSGVDNYDKNHSLYPMFSTNYNSSTPRILGGDNMYLMIKGKFIFSHNSNNPYNVGTYEFPKHGYRTTIWAKIEYIWCRLRVGEYYFNGYEPTDIDDDMKSKCWQKEPCDFKLYFGTYDDIKAREWQYRSQDIRNTVKWWYGINEEGCCVPVPEETLISNDVEFTMYTPQMQYDDTSKGHDARQFYVFIKDFDVKAVVGDPTYADRNKKDTYFQNVINDDYAKEMKDITFNITTDDGKSPNYSSVAYSSDTKVELVDKVYNEALAIGESDIYDENDEPLNGYARQEQHLLYRYFHQYSTPKVRLKLILENSDYKPYSLLTDTILNKDFFIDAVNIDYVTERTEIELRETDNTVKDNSDGFTYTFDGTLS